MTMEWHKFKCVQNKDNTGKFLINVKLSKAVLELTIVQNTVAWSAEIPQDMIEASAKNLKMSPADYLRRLKEHFNSDNVEFKFAKNEFVLQYTLPNNIKVKYLQCKLSKVQSIFECVSNLLQTMYDEKNCALNEMHSLKEETDHLRKSTMDLKCKLTEFISRKKKEEDTLYSNFVLVLNEKKTQIQHLTEMLEAFRHGRPTINKEPKTKEKTETVKTTKVKLEVKNEVSDSEGSEESYNTDDELLKSNKDDIEINDKKDEDFSDILGHDITKENIPTTSNKFSHSSLLHDSPPPTYHLPKRVKHNDKTDDIVSLSTYNAVSPKNNIKQEESDENSPCDTYDTQDLLDHI